MKVGPFGGCCSGSDHFLGEAMLLQAHIVSGLSGVGINPEPKTEQTLSSPTRLQITVRNQVPKKESHKLSSRLLKGKYIAE